MLELESLPTELKIEVMRQIPSLSSLFSLILSSRSFYQIYHASKALESSILLSVLKNGMTRLSWFLFSIRRWQKYYFECGPVISVEAEQLVDKLQELRSFRFAGFTLNPPVNLKPPYEGTSIPPVTLVPTILSEIEDSILVKELAILENTVLWWATRYLKDKADGKLQHHEEYEPEVPFDSLEEVQDSFYLFWSIMNLWSERWMQPFEDLDSVCEWASFVRRLLAGGFLDETALDRITALRLYIEEAMKVQISKLGYDRYSTFLLINLQLDGMKNMYHDNSIKHDDVADKGLNHIIFGLDGCFEYIECSLEQALAMDEATLKDVTWSM